MVKNENTSKLRKLTFDVYLISSIISAVADITIFAVLSTLVFGEKSPINILISTVIARITSSLVNFTLNWKLVFKKGSGKSVIKYYILWTIQLLASYGIALLFGNVLGGNLVIVKGIGDILLGFISFEVQYRWVFKEKKNKKFFGVLAIVCRFLLKLFSRRYDVLVKYKKTEGVVYVCRHLNMKGPLTTLKWFPFDLHPLVLSVFFDSKQGANHLKEYTFSLKRGKKIKKRSLKASLSGWFISKLVKSVKAVPVYRGNQNPLPTYKKAIEYLLNNQSVIVYPDIEYDKDYSEVSDIYDGFLYLSRFYKDKTGNDLKFVPLYIDFKNKVIIERDFISTKDIKTDIKLLKKYLICEINDKSA